jgi:hypothetical protein
VSESTIEHGDLVPRNATVRYNVWGDPGTAGPRLRALRQSPQRQR